MPPPQPLWEGEGRGVMHRVRGPALVLWCVSGAGGSSNPPNRVCRADEAPKGGGDWSGRGAMGAVEKGGARGGVQEGVAYLSRTPELEAPGSNPESSNVLGAGV